MNNFFVKYLNNSWIELFTNSDSCSTSTDLQTEPKQAFITSVNTHTHFHHIIPWLFFLEIIVALKRAFGVIWRVEDCYLGTFSADSAGQLDVLGHDGDTLGVAVTQVCVFLQLANANYQSEKGMTLVSAEAVYTKPKILEI